MIEEIKNYCLADLSLATSGQPNEEQFKEIKSKGFEVVINLGLLNQPYSLKDEKSLVEGLGLHYYHIPVEFGDPTEENYIEFSKTMEKENDKKIFIHCAANYRVSSFLSLYGQIKLQWTNEESQKYLKKIWEPNEIWKKFMENMKLKYLGNYGSAA